MKYLKKFNEGRALTDDEVSEITNLFSTFFDEKNWIKSDNNVWYKSEDHISYHIQKSHDYLFDSSIDDPTIYPDEKPFKLSSRYDGKDIKWRKPRYMKDIPNREKYLHESLVINIHLPKGVKEIFCELHEFIEDIKHYYGYLCNLWKPDNYNIRIHIATKGSNRFLGMKHT